MLAALMLVSAASCSGQPKPEKLEAEIKDIFRGAGSVEATADITADYGGGAFSFSVRYTGSADMGSVEILAPENISGITARVTFPECSLEYDGLSLEAGPLTGDGLSPVQALPVLLGQWTDGYAELMSFERLGGVDALALETRITEASSQRTWFDAETLMPLRSEIYGDGRMIVACKIESIRID
jgi:outer membrane lipoprotein-sorting protein